MKACIKKEVLLLSKQKSHFILLFLFSLLYMGIGYGVAKIEWESDIEQVNTLYYFIYIYPMTFSLLMLQLYPIAKDIKERYSGGIENLLCTPCSLKSIIGAKAICICVSIFLPPMLMIVVICYISKLWTLGLISMLVVTPMLNLGLSLIHVCNLIKKNGEYTTNSSSYISMGVILTLTYFPFLSYKYLGIFLNAEKSVALAGVLSVITLCIGIYKYKIIDISSIVQQF